MKHCFQVTGTTASYIGRRMPKKPFERKGGEETKMKRKEKDGHGFARDTAKEDEACAFSMLGNKRIVELVRQCNIY